MRTIIIKQHAKYVSSQLLIAITLLMSIELFYYFFPKYIPQNILLEMPLDHIAQTIGNDPRKKVTKLEGNPWVKFKPNTDIYDYRKEGEVASYVQKWRTDLSGFKNDPSVLRSGNIDVILLGDLHVEGFGTSPRQTMAGVLNFKHSLKSYSLGVQGYGPQQQMGALKRFGLGLKPKYVFFTQNGSSFTRAYKLENRHFDRGHRIKTKNGQ